MPKSICVICGKEIQRVNGFWMHKDIDSTHKPQKKKRTKKDLIGDLALALEIAAIQNQFGGWGFVSPFQDLVNRLLAEAGRKPVKRVKNPFKATRPGREIPA